MTAKERVMTALAFRPPDRIPLCDSYWPEFEAAWRQAKQIGPEADINDYYGVDVFIAVGDEGLAPTRAETLYEDDGEAVRRDSWGRVIRTKKGGYFYQQLESPVSAPADLERLVIDAPDLDVRYSSLDPAIPALKERFCVFAKVGGPFIRAQFVRGETEFLCDLAADPVFAHELARIVGRHLIAVGLQELRRWDLYDTGIWVYDDMASNLGPMFSPQTADRVLVPIWAEMVSTFKSSGARSVILHSDGNILPLLDRFIEIGFDGINPVEPKAGLDAVALRQRYGDRLVLIGGIDNAHILPRGNLEEVRDHVGRLVAMGLEGGFVAGMHSVGPDISVDTYDEVIRILRSKPGTPNYR